MTELIINGALVFAFLLACIEYTIQTVRIYKTKSSKDISIWASSMRVLGMLIVLAKIMLIGDLSLLIGQAILVIIFAIQFIFAIKFHNPR